MYLVCGMQARAMFRMRLVKQVMIGSLNDWNN